MKFELVRGIEILSQTPYTLQRMLDGLSPEWTASSGDRDAWAPYDVIGHLIHADETDWIPRAELILKQEEGATFASFDRLAQFDRSKGRSLSDLLTEFIHLRSGNLERLGRMQLTDEQLGLRSLHPSLGEVTLKQLLATWVVHDLNHIRQIATYMAKKYQDEVGPWSAYLAILD